MGPEIWVTIAAVFVAGGAIGSTGTLLSQWVLKKIDSHDRPDPDLALLRRDISALNRHLRNIDQRVDFTEQLLGGAITAMNPPSPLEPGEDEDGQSRPAEE